MSYWGNEFLPEWWNRKDAAEAERHGITVEEWRGFERDQRALEAQDEHRGRMALSGDDRNEGSKERKD